MFELNATGMQWAAVGGPVSAGRAGTVTLALGPTGTPYVTYYDDDLGGRATDVPYIGFRDENRHARASVMRFNSASSKWEFVGGAGFSTGGAIFISPALTGDGTPYLAYGDSNLDDPAFVMRLNAAGTGWEAVGGGPISAGQVSGTTMTLGLNGVPQVTFVDAANRNTISVMKASFGP